MRFLFVGTTREHGGAANHFVTLTRALAERGHEVHAVVHPQGEIAQHLIDSSVTLHDGTFRNALDPRGYRAVFQVAWRTQPDLLVTGFGKEYWPLILLSHLIDVPVALFRHRLPPLHALSNYGLPRLAEYFVAVSQYARRTYIAQGVPDDCVRVLYNPVDTSRCRPHPEQRHAVLRRLGLDEEVILVGYAGQMHEGKGIFTLLEALHAAMAHEPRLHGLWLGDGEDVATWRRQIEARGMEARHHHLGWVSDMSAFYPAMTLLAFPSVLPETFGRSAAEAQAAGVVVLGSDLGGIPETLQPDTTGLLLPAGDVEAWRDAILAMCDPVRRRPLAAAGRAFVQQQFEAHRIADAFVQMVAPHARRSLRTSVTRSVEAPSVRRPRSARSKPQGGWRRTNDET